MTLTPQQNPENTNPPVTNDSPAPIKPHRPERKTAIILELLETSSEEDVGPNNNLPLDRNLEGGGMEKPAEPIESAQNRPDELRVIELLDSRDGLTYARHNIAHFLTTDCELSTPTAKLLRDLKFIDTDDLKQAKPRKGDVLVTKIGK